MAAILTSQMGVEAQKWCSPVPSHTSESTWADVIKKVTVIQLCIHLFPRVGWRPLTTTSHQVTCPVGSVGLKACIKSKAFMPPRIIAGRSLSVLLFMSAINISDVGSKTSHLVIVTLPGASITLSQPTVPYPCSFIPSFAITISTHAQYKEMDIQILDTAVQSLTSLDLNCFFIALPYWSF